MMRSPRLLLRFGAELGSTALCAQSADLPCRSRTMDEAEHYVNSERICSDTEGWSPDRRLTLATAAKARQTYVRLHNSARPGAERPRW